MYAGDALRTIKLVDRKLSPLCHHTIYISICPQTAVLSFPAYRSASSSINSAQSLWCNSASVDLLLLLLRVVFWLTQKTLWNLIWTARASGLRHICRNLILNYANIAFHIFSCYEDCLNQSGCKLDLLENRFGLAFWTRPLSQPSSYTVYLVSHTASETNCTHHWEMNSK